MIALELETFRQSREGGNVTGNIFLELSAGDFPGKGWSDFPVIILSWWIDALLQLDASTRREIQWLFMDGPHVVTITKVEGTVSTGGIKFAEVQGSLLEAAERVVAHCELHEMFGIDLEALRQNIQRLKVNMALQRTGANHLAKIELRSSLADRSRH